MSDKPRKLTMKEEKAVRTYVKTGSKVEAIEASYNVKNRENAHKLAEQVFKRPVVQHKLAEILERRYPQHEEDFADIMRHAASLAKNEGDLKKVTEFLEKIGKLKGYAAPKEVHNKSLKATVKLPGSSD